MTMTSLLISCFIDSCCHQEIHSLTGHLTAMVSKRNLYRSKRSSVVFFRVTVNVISFPSWLMQMQGSLLMHVESSHSIANL